MGNALQAFKQNTACRPLEGDAQDSQFAALGSYVMLVKDIGACAESVGNHDYLNTPETEEYIYNGYEKLYGEKIQSLIEANLVPTVVKFWSEAPEDQCGLESAIYYSYLTRS